MSSEVTPISPARFAEALKDLPLSTLHLKAAELRNSIAHLDYSNEQLKPFAEGREAGQTGPDPDCVEAIKENEIVIARMEQRILLLKAEVESRGSSWLEFQSTEELEKNGLLNGDTSHAEIDAVMSGAGGGGNGLVTGEINGETREVGNNPWTDGTFQTGRVVGGQVVMNGVSTNGTTNGTGGRLNDEALRRAMEERMRGLGTEDEGDDEGMHL